MRIPDLLMPHRVDLHPLSGVTANGRTRRPTVPDQRAFVEPEEVLVRDSNGNEIVASTKVTLDPENAIPLDSTITLWKGLPDERTVRVVAIANRSNAMLEHVAYRLE